MMERGGNGIKQTFTQVLFVTGANAVPTDFEIFNKTNLPNLIFSPSPDPRHGGVYNFDEVTGQFLMERFGLMRIGATINVESAQASEFEIVPQIDIGSGFQNLPARAARTSQVILDQIYFDGPLWVRKGDKLRFLVNTTLASDFVTKTFPASGDLAVAAELPAALLSFVLSIR